MRVLFRAFPPSSFTPRSQTVIMSRSSSESKGRRGSFDRDERSNIGALTLSEELQSFQTVARVGDVADGTGIAVEVKGRAIALILDEGVYFAVDDQCPHQGAPLCDGIILDRTVTCTWHGWRFSLDDGRWIDSPRIRIGTYPVQVAGDEIQVAVD